jgi:hypothetical protein
MYLIQIFNQIHQISLTHFYLYFGTERVLKLLKIRKNSISFTYVVFEFQINIMGVYLTVYIILFLTKQNILLWVYIFVYNFGMAYGCLFEKKGLKRVTFSLF